MHTVRSILSISVCVLVALPVQAEPVQLDSRGFIDVWALRQVVAAAEDSVAAGAGDDCFAAGDPEEAALPTEQLKRHQAVLACEAAFDRRASRARSARGALNRRCRFRSSQSTMPAWHTKPPLLSNPCPASTSRQRSSSCRTGVFLWLRMKSGIPSAWSRSTPMDVSTALR